MSTRLIQGGAELNTIAEFAAEGASPGDSGTSSATISSNKAKTDTYSVKHTSTTKARGLPITSTTQILGGFFTNHNGTSGSGSVSKPILLWLTPSSGSAHYIVWDIANAQLQMYVNAVQVATCAVSTGSFSTTNVWYHIGFTFKAHASAGYFTVYLDGVSILTYSGNTTNTAGIISVLAGGVNGSAANGWNNNMYVDDMYVDDDTGGSDVAPPSPRFMWSLATTAGTNAGFTPSASTNISNVDDTNASAPDDDTTYNSASSASLKDTFNTADITVPVGYSLVARIPTAYARRTNAGVASTLSLVDYDGSAYTVGTAKTLGTSYGVVMDRFTTTPSAAALTQTNFNSSESGYQSAGSY